MCRGSDRYHASCGLDFDLISKSYEFLKGSDILTTL
jgi:hypothetical protein